MCNAFAGSYPNPTLKIKSPEEIWMKIAAGELNGQKKLHGRFKYNRRRHESPPES